MPKPSKRITPGGPVADLVLYLRDLRDGVGRPTFREMAARCNRSRSTLADAVSGTVCPTRKTAKEFAKACGADKAQQSALDYLLNNAMRPGVAARWRQARQRLDRNSIREASRALRRYEGQDYEAPDPYQPDPPAGGSAAEFVRELRALHYWAGKPGPKAILHRTGVRLAKSTMYDALNPARAQLPSLDVTGVIVRACAPGQAPEWIKAWRAIKMAEFQRDNPELNAAAGGR